VRIKKVLGRNVPHCSSSSALCLPKEQKDMFELSVMRGSESGFFDGRQHQSSFIEVKLRKDFDLEIEVRILEDHKSYEEAKERVKTKDAEWFYKVVFENLEPFDILMSFNVLYASGVKQGKRERSAELRKLLDDE